MDRDIGVVGAGPSGLAAAWRLVTRGARVTVYEPGVVGGRLRTETLSGTSADAVVQLVSDGYTRLRELAVGVGAERFLVPVEGRDAVWRHGRAHPVRYGSVVSMAASGSLPGLLKLRLGTKYMRFLERHAKDLDLNEPSLAAQAGLDDESIADWGTREMGRDFVELLCYPLLTSYYGVTPEETGAGVFHGLARAGLRVELLGIRGGAAALGRVAIEWLESQGVELRAARVDSLDAAGAGVRLRLDGAEARHDGVVVAVPAREAGRLLPGADLLASVQSRSTATLLLALDRPLATGWFGLSIPRGEVAGDEVAAVCIQEEKGTGVTAAGTGALTVVPTPDAGERWAVSAAADALDAALPVLDAVLPGARHRITEARLVRLPGSTFIPTPGHFGRMARLDPASLPVGVALAGDYLVAPTVEGAIRSGFLAADRVMAAAP